MPAGKTARLEEPPPLSLDPMSERPTFASVTDARCRCGYLRRSADDPESPIVFDRRTNEFHFRYREAGAEGDSVLVIYHCPFCGGAAPRSKRETLFHVIPRDEEDRLAGLMEGITTMRGALRRLGIPAWDNRQGTGRRMPEGRGRAPTAEWHRTLCYQNLSEVADVYVVERSDGRAYWRLQGKEKRRRRSLGRR
jgi:hypothetical protein